MIAGSSGTQTTYTDSACTTGAVTKTFTTTSCTATDSSASVMLAGCPTNPYDLSRDNLAVGTYYQAAGCSTQIIGTIGFLENTCYDEVDISPAASVKYDWPNAYFYATNDCSSTVVQTTNLDTLPCTQVVGIGNAATADAYVDFSYVGAAQSNVVMSFGVVASLMLVVMQLLRN
jgi:hypothetical protein